MPTDRLISANNSLTFTGSFPYSLERTTEEGEHYFLVRKTGHETAISTISELGYYVIQEFSLPTTYDDAFTNFIESIEIESEEEQEQFAKAFEEQFRNAMDNGVLIFSSL